VAAAGGGGLLTVEGFVADVVTVQLSGDGQDGVSRFSRPGFRLPHGHARVSGRRDRASGGHHLLGETTLAKAP
jgi:hypothetical protein